MRWLSILVLAIALVAAGCGGGDDESASDTTAITETTTDETTTDGTTTDDEDETTDTDDSGTIASEDCLELGSAAAALGQAFSGGGGDEEDVSALYDELAEQAPDEIKGDLETLAAAWTDIAAALQDLDLQAGEVPTGDQLQEYQAALASVSTPEVTAASERISAWAEENC